MTLDLLLAQARPSIFISHDGRCLSDFWLYLKDGVSWGYGFGLLLIPFQDEDSLA